MSEIFGIDVAKWNGTIDWSKVNISFAICKITKKDNSIEDSFERNYQGATAANIAVGGYRYVYAKNVTEALKEARGIADACRGKSLPMGIWLDMEDKSIKSLGKAKLTEIIRVEANALRDCGYNVGIYCNKDWFYNVLDGEYLSKEFSFWIARYPIIDTGKYNASSKLNPKSYAKAWQYSSKGKVNGISGNVDMDVFFGEIALTQQPGCPFQEPSVAVTSDANAKKYGIKNYYSRGAFVGWTQWHLQRLGYNIGKYGIDQKCGESTVTAIKQFQKDHELLSDGISGQNTREALKEA